jgi:hypothetical protein
VNSGCAGRTVCNPATGFCETSEDGGDGGADRGLGIGDADGVGAGRDGSGTAGLEKMVESPPDGRPDVAPPPADTGPSCTNPCTAGQKRCQPGGVQDCVSIGDCTAWGTPVACPAPMICQEGPPRCACPAGGCTVGQRRCTPAGDVEECAAPPGGCSAWQAQSRCNNFVCDQGICSAYECKLGFVRCETTCRNLLGACTVDSEHRVQSLSACTYVSGVRRYASTNDPIAVRDECRAMILEVARAYCAAQGGNWQASWVAFKGNGLPLRGSESMFGTCNPLAIRTDEWDTRVLDF